MTESTSQHSSHWERNLIENLTLSLVTERRRARYWGIFFKSLLFIYLFILLWVMLKDEWEGGPMVGANGHTALVEVHGIIAGDTDANAQGITKDLREALEDKNTKGVILRINSPGGSPVQSGIIYDEIKRQRKKNPNIPIYAVVEDVCASGGYYVAAATAKIYADKASVVGSIGVLMDGFGFVDAMNTLGVERRLLTSGKNKAILDPFSPQKSSDIQHAKALLSQIHTQFIDAVKEGRGARLGNDPDLFSGLFWTGEQGVELGLVDALGSVDYVAREVIGAKEIKKFTHKQDLIERFADRIGAKISQTLGPWAGVEGIKIR